MTSGDDATTGPQATYEKYLAAGLFMLQRARGSGKYVFYPRIAAPSGETDLEWVAASGLGTVHAITVDRGRDGHRNVALVDLDEGVRMMSTLPGVETAPIGARVRARIDTEGAANRVVFDLVEVEGEAP